QRLNLGESLLPTGVVRIGRGETLEDRQVFLQTIERFVVLLLICQDDADEAVAACEVGLPERVAGNAVGKLLAQHEALAITIEGFRLPALIAENIANTVIGSGEIAHGLPIVRLRAGKRLPDRQRFLIIRQRIVKPALLAENLTDINEIDRDAPLQQCIAGLVLCKSRPHADCLPKGIYR